MTTDTSHLHHTTCTRQTANSYPADTYPASVPTPGLPVKPYPASLPTPRLPGKPPNQAPTRPGLAHQAPTTPNLPGKGLPGKPTNTTPNSLPGDPPTTHIPGKRSSPHLAYPANLAMRRPLPHGWTYPANTSHHCTQTYPASPYPANGKMTPTTRPRPTRQSSLSISPHPLPRARHRLPHPGVPCHRARHRLPHPGRCHATGPTTPRSAMLQGSPQGLTSPKCLRLPEPLAPCLAPQVPVIATS